MGATPGLDDVGGETEHTWKQFLRVDDLGGIQATLKQIVDGDGVALPLKISTSQVEIDALKVASLSGIIKGTAGVFSAITDDSSDWNAAYSHISNDGSDHSFIDQSVVNGASPTFTGTNITGVPAASVLAGTFGAGSYIIDTDLDVQNGINVGTASGATVGQIITSGHIRLGSDGTADTNIRLYSDTAGRYITLYSFGTSSELSTAGSGNDLSINSADDLLLTVAAGKKMSFDAGGVFEWRDKDDSNAVKMTLASNSGNLAITGNFQVIGGDIGIAADTDLIQLAANALTVNGATEITGALTLSNYTATYIPFFEAGGLISEDSAFQWDNTNKTLFITEGDIEGHIGLELKNSRTANVLNTESLLFRLKVDDTSTKRALKIEASFSDIGAATADSLIHFKTNEGGAIGDALTFAGYTVRAEKNLIIGNDGDPKIISDKSAGGTAEWQMTRNVTSVDWSFIHDASENLTLKGLNENKDFTININDGGVQKDVFKIDSSVPSISMPNITLLEVGGDLDVGGKISFNTSTFSAVGPTDNVDVSEINTLFIDNSGNAVTIGGFAGGVDGQVLYVTLINAGANNVTIEHNEGGATQPIFLHKGSDESLNTEYGGWVFVCHNGTDWHDCSHAQHV